MIQQKLQKERPEVSENDNPTDALKEAYPTETSKESLDRVSLLQTNSVATLE